MVTKDAAEDEYSGSEASGPPPYATYPPPPSSAPARCRAPRLARCNFVVVKRRGDLRTTLVLDPGLAVPAPLRADPSPDEAGANLLLRAAGRVDARVWLVRGARAPRADMAITGATVRAVLAVAEKGSMFGLSVRATRGSAELRLPREFRGALTLTVDDHNVELGGDLAQRVATFSEVGRVRRCFVGKAAGTTKSAALSSVDVTCFGGKIVVKYVEDSDLAVSDLPDDTAVANVSPPKVSPSNFVFVSRDKAAISDAIVLDPALPVPAPLIAHMDTDPLRKNLFLQTGGRIDVLLRILGDTSRRHPSRYMSARPRTQLRMSGEAVRTVVTTSAFANPFDMQVKSTKGNIVVQLPRSFRGLLVLHTDINNVDIGADLAPQIATFSDIDNCRKCFVGDLPEDIDDSTVRLQCAGGGIKLSYSPADGRDSRSWWPWW